MQSPTTTRNFLITIGSNEDVPAVRKNLAHSPQPYVYRVTEGVATVQT